MDASHRDGLHTLRAWATQLRWLPALGGLMFVLVFLRYATARMAYPFELEWMEGASADHVARILDGKPLYVAPSVDFVPFLYTPLFYYVGAVAAWVFGLSLPILRGVSFVATLVSFGLLFDLVRRETDDSAAALVAVGLFSACWPLTGCWYELVRVDSLAFALALGGLWFARRPSPTAWTLFGVGAFWGLAYLTKQTMLLVVAGPALWLVWTHRRRAVHVAIGAILVVGTASVVFMVRAPGWYLFYTSVLPGSHPVWLPGWRALPNMLLTLPFAFVGVVALIAVAPRASLYACFIASALLTSMLAMMHSGAAGNVLIPGFAGLSMAGGLGLGFVVRALRNASVSNRVAVTLATGFSIVGACAQLWSMRYRGSPQLPSEEDRQAAMSFVEHLRTMPGEVYVQSHGFLSSLAGRPVHAHEMAIVDVLRSSRRVEADALASELDATFRGGRFAAIITDTKLDGTRLRLFDQRYANYRFSSQIIAGNSAMLTRNGLRCRPFALFLRR